MVDFDLDLESDDHDDRIAGGMAAYMQAMMQALRPGFAAGTRGLPNGCSTIRA